MFTEIIKLYEGRGDSRTLPGNLKLRSTASFQGLCRRLGSQC